MKLRALPKKTIIEYIDNCYKEGQYGFCITVLNGLSIFGYFMSRSNEDYLTLSCCGGMSVIQTADIKFDMIAGIHALSFSVISAPKNKIDRKFDLKVPNHHGILMANFKRNAARIGLANYSTLHYAYPIRLDNKYLLRDIVFTQFTPIYSDWEYFSIISGGLTGLGLGAVTLSFSYGWDDSLFSIFKGKLGDKTTTLNNVCSHNQVVVKCYVSIIEKNVKLEQPQINNKDFELTMEGKSWIPAALTKNKVTSKEELSESNWILAFLKKDGFMIPKELINNIVNPIMVFADVIPARIITEVGEVNCFLKIRGAASVEN